MILEYHYPDQCAGTGYRKNRKLLRDFWKQKSLEQHDPRLRFSPVRTTTGIGTYEVSLKQRFNVHETPRRRFYIGVGTNFVSV